MMNAGIEEKNTGAMSPEGVMDGTPEITEENLFELVDSGKISFDQADEFLRGLESADDTKKEDVSLPEEKIENEPDETGGVVPGNENKPFRVYNTQEEFQRDFDRSWNHRYGKMKSEQEARDAEHDALLSDVADLLGVSKENAASELKRRKQTVQAEKAGRNPDEFIEVENLRAENEMLKKTQRETEAQAVVRNIREQGERISAVDPSFNIDDAMSDEQFAGLVFSLRRSRPDTAVSDAYRIFYGDKKSAVGSSVGTAPTVSRPSEGAAVAKSTGERKPVDFSKKSSREIKDLEKRLLSGEKIEL